MPKWNDDEIKFAKELQKSIGDQRSRLIDSSRRRCGPARKILHPTISAIITWNVPMGTLRFPSAILGVQAHHWTAGIAPTTSIAHKGAVVGRQSDGGVDP